MVVANDRRRLVVYLIGFLDLLAVSVVIPALPVYLRKSLGASPTITGLITSLYGAIQLLSSPVVGGWSDSKGRGYVLSVCLLLSSTGYLFLGLCMQNLLLITVIRIIPGFFKHTQEMGRCLLIEDCKSQRYRVLGLFHAISSIGFMIGPSIHGHLVAKFGLENGFLISCVMCYLLFVINFFIALSFGFFFSLGENDTSANEVKMKENNNSNRASNEVEPRWKFSVYHKSVFAMKFLHSLGVMIFRSSFVLWLMDCHPDLPPTTVGYLSSASGLFGLIFGFSVGPLSTIGAYKNNDERLHVHASLLLLFSLLSTLLFKNVYAIVIALMALSLATAILRVSGVVLSARHLPDEAIGQAQGIGSSLLSLARFIAPIVVGLLQEYSPAAPNQAAFVLSILAIFIYYRYSNPIAAQKSKTE